MNMFARFDENPAMTLRVIKETKRYGRTHGHTDGRTDGRTDGQRENSIPPTNKVCGGYNYMSPFPSVGWGDINKGAVRSGYNLFTSEIKVVRRADKFMQQTFRVKFPLKLLKYSILVPFHKFSCLFKITVLALKAQPIICSRWQLQIFCFFQKYHTLFFSKIEKDVPKIVVCCSCDWRFKGLPTYLQRIF